MNSRVKERRTRSKIAIALEVVDTAEIKLSSRNPSRATTGGIFDPRLFHD